MVNATPYVPKNSIRIVTAASLFDGHDASINIMRRILQGMGDLYIGRVIRIRKDTNGQHDIAGSDILHL
jgi:hypothetical protein